MNSWPMMKPVGLFWWPRKTCSSEPQRAVYSTFRTASEGDLIVGTGRVSTLMSKGPLKMTAFIVCGEDMIIAWERENRLRIDLE